MNDMAPRVVIPFPKQHRRADCQREAIRFPELKLIDQLKRISDGMDAGMTAADIQHEYDAQQAEKVISHWARKLAENPRRSSSLAATFLCTTAGILNGDEAS